MSLSELMSVIEHIAVSLASLGLLIPSVELMNIHYREMHIPQIPMPKIAVRALPFFLTGVIITANQIFIDIYTVIFAIMGLSMFLSIFCLSVMIFILDVHPVAPGGDLT
jgi:hypothetical protein